mgnify:CR=1 FL=1
MEIGASLGFVDRYLAAHGIDDASLDEILSPYIAASEWALPHLVEQLRGIAVGADRSFAKVMAANAFEEIYGQVELGVGRLAPLERCTDVVVSGIGGPMLGLDEHDRLLVIVPMFLGVGKHAREDLPALLSAIRQNHPSAHFTLLPSIGEDPRLLDLAAIVLISLARPQGLVGLFSRQRKAVSP